MKIGVLGVRCFPPKMSGIDRQMFELSKQLARNGHDVYVFAAESGESPMKKIHLIRVPSIRMEVADMSLSFLTYNFFSVPVIARAVRKYGLDVLHLNNPPAGFAGAVAKKITGVPLVYTMRGTIPDNIKARGKAVGKILGMLEAPAVRNADMITAITGHIAKVAGKYYSKMGIAVIPNGIVSRGKGTPGKVRKELGLKRDSRIILFVGRLVGVKGIEYLIKAMAGVVKKFPEAALVLVGDGPMRRNLENMTKQLSLENSVHFAGMRNDVENFFQAAEIMVLPSLHEGFPNVVLEAMCYGVPVIATDIMGNPDVIKKEFGLLVRPRDSAELSRAIIRVLSDSRMLKTMSREAKKEAKKYSWSAITRKYEDAYRSAIARRS